MNRKNFGFTLIELLIVIAILGVLAAGVVVAINPAKRLGDARNAQRKTDLGQMAQAIEAYAVLHSGQYPTTSGTWCGLCSPYTACGTDWIPGLVASGDLKILPKDPGNNGAGKCYLYRSDATGTNYKLLAWNTPEGTWNSTDLFYDPTRPTTSWQISSPGGRNW
jgi:prepilin-type N-terminal cleavage/methylation domain-containing protein